MNREEKIMAVRQMVDKLNPIITSVVNLNDGKVSIHPALVYGIGKDGVEIIESGTGESVLDAIVDYYDHASVYDKFWYSGVGFSADELFSDKALDKRPNVPVNM